MDDADNIKEWNRSVLPPDKRFPVRTPNSTVATINKARYSMNYDPAVHNRVLARRKRMLEAERKASEERTWGPIDDCMFNRFELMEYLLTKVSSGVSLPKVLEELTRACTDGVIPDLMMVRGWCRFHPDFGHAMAIAEEIRGEILGEQSLQDLLDADATGMSREELGLLKMQTDAKAKAAARKNASFQDKTVVEHKDPNEGQSLEDMEKRLADLLKAHPAIAASVAGKLSHRGDDDAEVVSE